MRTVIRSTALAVAVFATACTPLEIAVYLDTTADTRDALSADQLYRLRLCESTDNYRAISPSGTYRGAYQFDQTTWDGVATRHFDWLVGVDPVDAEPWWQDAMARALWSERGDQPWPVCGKKL
ncbi:MAG: transglycosylase family protein [Acidimicrobiales bacterium]